MFTSEIRQTDQEGKPIRVSPNLMARVQKADDIFRARLEESESKFSYAAQWVFPEPEKTMLSLQVRIPNKPETFTYGLSPNALTGDLEGFVGQAIQMVLGQANKDIQARIDRHLHNLLVSSSQEE